MQRRLIRDLAWACIGPVIALVGGLLVETERGYPLTFGITWFVVGLVRAALHYFNREAQPQGVHGTQ